MIKTNPLNKMYYQLPLAVILITFISLLVNMAHASNRISPIGINTNEAMDINASVPFVNLFKLALPFEHARPWLTKGKITYDKNGWPTNLNGGKAGTRFISNLPGLTLPQGVYTVTYKGSGEIIYGVDAKLVRRYPGKDLVRIRPGKNGRISASLTIKKSDPNNHIRDVSILMPGGVCHGNPYKRVNGPQHCGGRKYYSFEKHHKNIIFNPDYLNFMKDFKVLRFMNMSGITRNDLSDWNKRPKVDQATWGGKEGVRGVPLEIMVKLANRLNADPWFNIPHKADDYFIRRYAQYVKDNLKPGLKAYLEYTNEAWNGIFTQSHYMKTMGMQEKLDRDKNIAGYKYFSKRSVEVFQIWHQVFGDTKRFIRVMGGMTTNVNLSHMLLGYREAYKYTDALAVAPYFYASQRDTKLIRSVNQAFKLLTADSNKYSLQNILKSVRAQAKLCKTYGVDMIAYEGGQHLVAYGTHTVREGPNPYIIQANKDKRMAQLYYRFLKGWKEAGGQLFVAFSAPRQYTWIGSWGIKEYITQSPSVAPKYRALMAFAKSDRCWWKNCSSSGPIVRLPKPKSNPGTKTFARFFRPVGAEKPPHRDPHPQTQFASSSKTPQQINAERRQQQLAQAKQQQQKRQAARQQQLAQAKLRQQQAAAKRQALAKAQQQQRRPLWQPQKDDGKGISNTELKSALALLNEGGTSNNAPAGGYDLAIRKVKNPRQIFTRRSPNRLQKLINGRVKDGKDLAAGWQAHWDPNFLHVKVDIADDNIVIDSKQPWGDDSIELYIDADGSRTAAYDGNNDFQFIYRWKDKSIGLGANSPKRVLRGIRHKVAKYSGGYSLTTSIPWKTLGVTPRTGHKIGIDIHINDDDNGQGRDGKIAWMATKDKSWQSPKMFGQVVLSN